MSNKDIVKLKSFIVDLQEAYSLLDNKRSEITIYDSGLTHMLVTPDPIEILESYINSDYCNKEIVHLFVIFLEGWINKIKTASDIDEVADAYEGAGFVETIIGEYLPDQGEEGAIYALKEACGLLT